MFEKLAEFSKRSVGPGVNLESAPYSVLIMNTDLGLICTGTLVTLNIIITAARCVHNGTIATPEDLLEVYAGANSLASLDGPNVQTTSIIKNTVHPNFRLSNDEAFKFGHNDVALLDPMDPFQETPYVQPIPLGYPDWTDHPDGLECSLAMYSSVDPLSVSPLDDKLWLTTVTASHDCQCAEQLDQFFGQSTKRWICPTPERSGPGPCFGSAGAGLICEGKLAAVLVGTIIFDSLDQCMFLYHRNVTCMLERTLPVFLNLCPFMPWMYYELQKDDIPPECSGSSCVNTTTAFGFLLLFAVLCGNCLFRK